MSQKTFEINSCEVCGNKDLIPVLNLGLHPMCDDLVEVNSTRICKEYPIEIVFCTNCITAHQKFQIPKDELFPKTYHYRSRFTADVLNGMKSLVAETEKMFGSLSGKRVVDIGCNDGSLLGFFREKGAITIGIEPTGAAADAQEKGHAVYNKFLSVDVAKQIVQEHGTADFISFTNVFAHIENLGEVVSALKCLLSPNTVIVIENHYLGSVLDRNQFDTFYHEHPRTYSFTSFVHIARSLGSEIKHVEFPSRYGGNIRVFIGQSVKASGFDVKEIEEREKGYQGRFEKMSNGIGKWIDHKKKEIDSHIQKSGKLKAKAFPGRSAILVKLLGLNENHISAVYEKPGSMKIDHYVPGTRIPIKSDDDLFKSEKLNEPILNFAWHISAEIKNYLKSNGYTGEVIDILSNEDFQ